MLISGNLKLNSLDYVLIVDRDYNIIFNTRYESKVNSTAKDFSKDEYLKKIFLKHILLLTEPQAPWLSA